MDGYERFLLKKLNDFIRGGLIFEIGKIKQNGEREIFSANIKIFHIWNIIFQIVSNAISVKDLEYLQR